MLSLEYKTSSFATAIVLILLLISASSCDLQHFADKTTMAEVTVHAYSSATEKETAHSSTANNYTINSIEIDFDEINLSNQQNSVVQFYTPGDNLIIDRFEQDLELSEGLLIDPVYNKMSIQMGRESGNDRRSESSVKTVQTGDEYSINITGTFDEAEFSFSVYEYIDLDFNLSPPVKIENKDDAAIVIRILIDYAEWFTAPDTGELLSPLEEANQEIITDNIRKSITLDLFQPVISINDAEASLGEEKIEFDVHLSGVVNSQITVDYHTADQSAKAGVDFTESSGTILFNPGETVKTIKIDLLQAFYNAPHRRFRVLLSNASGAKLDKQNRRSTGLILNNNDAFPLIEIHDAASETGQETISFTAELSQPSEQPVTVAFQTSDQSAKAGVDYLETSGILTFEPGETTATIDVELLGAEFNAPQRRFRMQLSDATGAELRMPYSMATGTIQNDPGNSNNVVLIHNSEADLGDELITFYVELLQAADQPVTVSYHTSDQSAKAGTDYVSDEGTLTLEPGELSKEIDIQLLGAPFNPPQKRFMVHLTDPQGAGLENPNNRATGTIHNDPGNSNNVVLIHDSEADLGDELITFYVELLEAADHPVTVSYYTSDQSAKAGTDYVSDEGTLTLEPGELSKEIDIQLLGNPFNPPQKRFMVHLTDPQGAGLENPNNRATGTIHNN